MADIVMFYRSAKSVCTVTAAAIARESTICDLVDGTTSAGVVGNVGVGIGSGGASGGDGDAGMLTLIVRPLPSTAPASLASDSSRGEGESGYRCRRFVMQWWSRESERSRAGRVTVRGIEFA